MHLYLAAWVAGGLLLGASLLLDGRESPDGPRPADDPRASRPVSPAGPEDNASAELERPLAPAQLSPGSRIFRLCSLALIGFGLCGLTAKGLDIDMWPWTLVCALTAGVLLFALGYRLSRSSSRRSV